ncbi:MAG: MFS transporter [Paramuribaculum sp.]|nr:MFS transporter [Paramuribaculum sp.]
MNTIKYRLTLMSFLEFAVWGSYLVSLPLFLSNQGLQDYIYWFYTVQGIVSLFMPALVGIIADRWVPAQRMLSACHVVSGLFMALAATYALVVGDGNVSFGPLFTLYTISVAFFMPTIGLGNSVAFNALNRAGLDTVKHFPPIRVFGTVGFIAAMWFVNFTNFQTSYMQLYTSAVFGLIMAFYSLSLPMCPVNPAKGNSLYEALGLQAFALFKRHKMALFFIFSMLLGVALQVTNSYGSTYINCFSTIPQYADDWFARNPTFLISLSQVSETFCILLIPFALRKFGIKGVMLMSMFAWVLRFGFFGIGDTSSGIWLLVLSCIIYGVAFDFFNVSGGLFVDKETDSSMRSSAQGLFMIMTNGIGATVGTIIAGECVVNKLVYAVGLTAEQQLAGWRESWFIFAGYALVVAVLFIFLFHDKTTAADKTDIAEAEESAAEPDGFVSE